MPSELWQRLREVRKYADKTQAAMAKAVGVTRSGYAFWENSDPEQRTRPNVEQAVIICELTGVPVEWLLDDRSDVNDLWRGTFTKHPAQTKEPEPPAYASPPSDRAQQRFWAAVEYAVTAKDPARDTAFGQVARAGAVEMILDYLYNGTAAVFSRSAADEDLVRVIGYLLTAARITKATSLHILVNSEELPSPGLLESARRFLSVTVNHVTTPEQAASILLSAK
jgi:DNA-binding XRE family transcriptional regulator